MTDQRSQYNTAVERLRDAEYPMIQGSVYLDHSGTTLCSKSLVDRFAREIATTLYGNPHSASLPSQLSTAKIDDVRLNLLTFLNADPSHFDLVFVANATAGIKLVVEGLRACPGGYGFVHHDACHTSVVGAREDAAWSRSVSDEDLVSGLILGREQDDAPTAVTLFAYSAQSHFDGQRFPLSWSRDLRNASSGRLLSLLDASSYCATSPLNLGAFEDAPDFTVLSLYKIFGFPDLGLLLVKKSAEDVFSHRRYFGGGTVDMVVCGKHQWHAPKAESLHQRLEDGTLPFHNIIAAGIALEVHRELFGDMECVAAHTLYLSTHLRQQLRSLSHANGSPLCEIYEHNEGQTKFGQGPIVAFNLRDARGDWVSLAEFEKLAHLKQICVRTGGLCSPGGIASALRLEPWEMRRNFSAGFRCGAENDIVSGKPTGAVRASLGPMSTLTDVTKFIDFLTEYFLESNAPEEQAKAPIINTHSSALRVRAITVFPVKSCGGYSVPAGVDWEVNAEGLAWDREWCLVHRGSSHALSQKRYPRMALLKPDLDFEKGVLRVRYLEGNGQKSSPEIEIPLSEDPAAFRASASSMAFRVCGEAVSMLTCVSTPINDFFSNAIGVPCALAKLPTEDRTAASRTSKARMQAFQRKALPQIPGSFPGVPSPPDSDSETQTPGNLRLSNESPILVVTSASIDALNETIAQSQGQRVADSAFRANIVIETLESSEGLTGYEEDQWKGLCIGEEPYELLGACRRCQMVCVNQETGERGQEPLNTLAKTRRFDGKVFFGAHMRHTTMSAQGAKRRALIRVGDNVVVDQGSD